ncbi:MAG TPA: hybrid sensor histidine kinase/response regulator [Polyangia bacterium]
MPNPTLRLLLVDDNEDDRFWVRRLLIEGPAPPAAIHQVGSVSDALTFIEAEPVDLVIADFNLPDGTGIELAGHPTVLAAQLPVIVVTGAERPDQGAAAVERGAADFLPKDDITARTLWRACAHSLARNRLEREVATLRKAEIAAAARERQARIEAEVALEKERRAREYVASLHALSSTLLTSHQAAGLAELALAQIAKFDRVSAITVYLLHGEHLVLHDSAGYTATELAAWNRLPLSANTPLAIAVREERVVRVENQTELRRYLPSYDGPAVSWLAVPLMVEGRPHGVLGIRFQEGALPSSDGVAFIELIGQHLAQALVRESLTGDLRQAAAFEERLLAVVGHDLRTPISAILMVAQALKLRQVDPKLIARLERSGRWMADLISHVLERAAIRRGVATAAKVEPESAETVLRDRLDELRAAFPGSDLRLAVKGAPSGLCDPVRTSQVVSNLVRNAIQHGQSGTPVSIDLTNTPNTITIRVHNHGKPIPADELPLLFDPFRRGRLAGGVGTGLGLFIVREAVTALKGEVTAASDESGTTLTVVLPSERPAESGERSSEGNGDGTRVPV